MLELVNIVKGSFLMGSSLHEEGRDWYRDFDPEATGVEDPQHYVTIKEFQMGKYLITQDQWFTIAELPLVQQELNPNPAFFKGSNLPVEQVSWEDAVEFCARLSRETGHHYRLPSESEWEYACRAGTTTPFHSGETITTDLANYRGTDWEYQGKVYSGAYGSGSKGIDRKRTTEVGSFPPNAFGLYDMHGNVWEWCLDYWHGNYQGAPVDGSAWVTGGDEGSRVLRGGSWHGNPWCCRSAHRYYSASDNRYLTFGFRVVCSSAQNL